MPIRIQSTKAEMVDSFEVRVGSESLKVHFGRKVPITRAVTMLRDWLSAIDEVKP